MGKIKGRFKLFPGTHCEPLSPALGRSKKEIDQINTILNVMGPLDDADVCFVTDRDIADSLKQLHDQGNPDKVDWKSRFPLTNDGLITVLKGLLEFNPYLRKKPEDLL